MYNLDLLYYLDLFSSLDFHKLSKIEEMKSDECAQTHG